MKPVLQALLLADRIYEDKMTGKHVVAGIFNMLFLVKDGPIRKRTEVDGEEKDVLVGGAEAGGPYVYISLTDVRGNVDCVLRYVNLERNEPLFQKRFSVRCTNPLETVELVFPMPSLPGAIGVYALELLCDDEPIGSYRVVAKEMEKVDGNDFSN